MYVSGSSRSSRVLPDVALTEAALELRLAERDAHRAGQPVHHHEAHVVPVPGVLAARIPEPHDEPGPVHASAYFFFSSFLPPPALGSPPEPPRPCRRRPSHRPAGVGRARCTRRGAPATGTAAAATGATSSFSGTETTAMV